MAMLPLGKQRCATAIAVHMGLKLVSGYSQWRWVPYYI